jgi:hypothetical protein
MTRPFGRWKWFLCLYIGSIFVYAIVTYGLRCLLRLL